VAAITVAATVNHIQTRGETIARPPPVDTERGATVENDRERGEETRPGPLPSVLPLPGELREAGGILWWSDDRCRAASLELSSGAVEVLADKHCRLWPAPDGAHAVALAENQPGGLEGRGLVLIEGRAGAGRVIAHTAGFLVSEPAWAADGLTFAACFGTRKGLVTDLRALDGAGQSGNGLCFPAWAELGFAAARIDPPSLELGGETVLGAKDLEKLLPSVPEDAHREVSALGAGPGDRLAVAVVAVSAARALPLSAALAVVSRVGAIEFSARLTRDTLPAAIGLSPDGTALWYLDAGKGVAVLLNLPGGRRRVPYDARWVSWSPDGRYMAAATDQGIELSTWPNGEELAVLQVKAASLTWTRSP
jgi:WD40-like Beta Propeller Repeat